MAVKVKINELALSTLYDKLFKGLSLKYYAYYIQLITAYSTKGSRLYDESAIFNHTAREGFLWYHSSVYKMVIFFSSRVPNTDNDIFYTESMTIMMYKIDNENNKYRIVIMGRQGKMCRGDDDDADLEKIGYQDMIVGSNVYSTLIGLKLDCDLVDYMDIDDLFIPVDKCSSQYAGLDISEYETDRNGLYSVPWDDDSKLKLVGYSGDVRLPYHDINSCRMEIARGMRIYDPVYNDNSAENESITFNTYQITDISFKEDESSNIIPDITLELIDSGEYSVENGYKFTFAKDMKINNNITYKLIDGHIKSKVNE